MQRAARMKRELEMLVNRPPHGISCWSKGDSIEMLQGRTYLSILHLQVIVVQFNLLRNLFKSN